MGRGSGAGGDPGRHGGRRGGVRRSGAVARAPARPERRAARGRHVALPRRERGDLGAGRPGASGRRRADARLGRDRGGAARALSGRPGLRRGHGRRPRPVAADGRGGDPPRRPPPGAAARAGRTPPRSGGGERRQSHQGADVGLARNDARRRRPARADRGRRLGPGVAVVRRPAVGGVERRSLGAGPLRTGGALPGPRARLGRKRPCALARTPPAGRGATGGAGTPCRRSRAAPRTARGRPRTVAALARAAAEPAEPGPHPVVSRRTRHGRVACADRPRRRRAHGPPHRGRRAHLARGAPRQGRRPLPRDRRQRLRPPQAVRAHRRRARGSAARGRSRCTPSSRSSTHEPSTARATTPSGPATSVPPATSRAASAQTADMPTLDHH